MSFILIGKTLSHIFPYHLDVSLVSLGKKAGGIRLIAVGSCLHWLVTKCESAHAMVVIPDLLASTLLRLGCLDVWKLLCMLLESTTKNCLLTMSS